MSGLSGIVDFSGAPIDLQVLHAMSAVSQGLGPGGSTRKLFLGAALNHLSLASTPEALTEQQPVFARGETVCLVGDVRLDNRAELIDCLGSRGLLQEPSPGDATLLLAAYLHWGTSCPKHLLGDFAFAVWDARERLLFCARDPLGIKPLHYARVGSLVCFASEAQQVLQHPSIPRHLDEATIADYLMDTQEDPQRTFFRDVNRLAPGHLIVFTAAGDRMECYWDIDPERRIVYRDEGDYAAHFLSLFERAVADRLRTPSGPVGILMSGGLDSPSVASVARRIAPRNGSPELFAASFVFPNLPECDERTYIAATAGALDLETELVEADQLWPLRDPHAFRPRLENPFFSWESAFQEMLRRLQGRGSHILLTGHGGDDLMAGSLFVYADRLRRGDLRVLAETVPHALSKGRSGWRTLYHYFGEPLLPRAITGAARRILRRPIASRLPAWVRPDFIARSGVMDRISYVPSQHARGAAWQELYDEVIHFHSWNRALHWYTWNASPFGIEVRHPFLDRRIAEFMLAIPSRQRSRPGCYKPFLRRAMSGVLPEMIRQRSDKTSLGPFFGLGLKEKEKIENLLADPVAAELGIVNAEKLREEYQRYVNNNTVLSQLWYVITLEIWLKKIGKQLDRVDFHFPGAHPMRREAT